MRASPVVVLASASTGTPEDKHKLFVQNETFRRELYLYDTMS